MSKDYLCGRSSFRHCCGSHEASKGCRCLTLGSAKEQYKLSCSPLRLDSTQASARSHHFNFAAIVSSTVH